MSHIIGKKITFLTCMQSNVRDIYFKIELIQFPLQKGTQHHVKLVVRAQWMSAS